MVSGNVHFCYRRNWKFLGEVGGGLSAQILTKCMKHNWNDHRGGVGGVRKHPFSDNLEH